jgi:hypothetical protein
VNNAGPPSRLEQTALEYLSQQLGERAPRAVRFEAAFDESPLEGEGRTELFSFDLPRSAQPAGAGCQPEDLRHYVAVGQTVPNYFPGYGLDAEDAYSFHLGTRFMLTMEVQRVDSELEPPGARSAARAFVADHAPRARASDPQLAALFRCEDEYFAVYRLEVDGDPIYLLGADCPPGFYRMAQHPPQAALRLHLGKLVRAEARREVP